MVTQLNESNFLETIEGADKTVLVDFYADWCGPCKMMAPVVAEFAEEHQDIAVYKVNIDECPEVARKYGIMSIPTFISFQNGQVSKKALGAMPKNQLEELIK